MNLHFDVNDRSARESLLGESLGSLLEKADPDRKPVWGSMSLQQMVEHLLWTFEISTGRVSVPCPMPLEWQEKARPFLLDNRETPRGFENPLLKDGLPSLRFAKPSEAVFALRDEARRFLELSSSQPETRRVHPVFGALVPEEWSRTHFKHCAHHLLQFGLIELIGERPQARS